MSRGKRGVRGGLGVRKAAADRLARSTKYQLVGVRAGSLVVEVLHRVKMWQGPTRRGIITRNSGTAVFVLWQGEAEPTYYTGGDARYFVDTDQWRIGEVQNAAFRALTTGQNAPRVMLSPHNEAADTKTEERYTMSTEMPRTEEELKKLTLPTLRQYAADLDVDPKQKKADLIAALLEAMPDDELDDDELEDDVEIDDEADDEAPEPEIPASLGTISTDDDELDDEQDEVEDAAPEATPEPAGETYTAKQIATRIGTDAKVLRKFFRSPASTIEPVGQGGRYEFAKSDLEKIKKEFETWQSGNKARGVKRSSKPAAPTRAEVAVEEIEEDDTELELDDEEPTSSDLEELDLELDDDDELED